MKRRLILFTLKYITISALFSLLLLPENLKAQTAVTSWPMFRNNPQHTSQRNPNSNPNEPDAVKQKFPPINTGPGFIADITSSPSIDANGTVFIGSLSKDFFAIDPETGNISGTFKTFNSVFSSPAIGNNGNIYVGSWDGSMYELLFTGRGFELLNYIQSGAENFGHLEGRVIDGENEVPLAGAIVSIGGTTAISDNDGDFFFDNIPKGSHKGIVSHQEKDCERTINIDICGLQVIQNIGEVSLHDFVVSTVIDDEGVPVCPSLPELNVECTGSIFAGREQTFLDQRPLPVDLDGRFNLRSFNPSLLIENGIAGSPLIGFNNWIYWGSQNGRFYGWDRDTGSLFFRIFDIEKDESGQIDPIVSSPAQSLDGTVYIISQRGFLYGINPDFSLTFELPFVAGGDVISSPAIGVDGTIYFGSLDSNLYAVLPGGELKWKFLTGGAILSSPAIDKDGTIYVGSDDGNVYAINDDGLGSPVEKWRLLVGEEIAGASPSIGKNGTIYIGTGGEFPRLLAITKDGLLKWCTDTENGITSTPAIAEDGTIFAGSFDGKVYALVNDEKTVGSITISGTVTNSVDNTPVTGALVEITRSASQELICDNFSTSTITDDNGNYALDGVPEGSFDITVSLDDFTGKTEKGLEITDDIIGKNFTLQAEGEIDVEIKKVAFSLERDLETCFPLLVKFFNQSEIDPPDVPVEYLWKFGDGTSSMVKNPEHEYTQKGDFEIELEVRIAGTTIKSTSTRTISVKGAPCAKFQPANIKVKPGQLVSFTNLSEADEGQEIINTEWIFSSNKRFGRFLPGNRSTNKNPSHEFRGVGEHSVSMFIQQSDGKDDKAFGTVTVTREF